MAWQPRRKDPNRGRYWYLTEDNVPTRFNPESEAEERLIMAFVGTMAIGWTAGIPAAILLAVLGIEASPLVQMSWYYALSHVYYFLAWGRNC